MLIDQILYDPAPGIPDPGGEWVLLRNAAADGLRVSGWWLRDSQKATLLPPLEVPAGALVLVMAAEAGGDAGLPAAAIRVELPGRIGNGLRNAGDSLALLDAAGTVIDAVSWGDDRSIFDPPVPRSQPGQPIRRRMPGDSNTARDWLDADGEIPGRAQPVPPRVSIRPTAASVTSATKTAGPAQARANPAAASTSPALRAGAVPAAASRGTAGGMVVVSEVAPHAGWVELYNRGPSAVDLRGWSLEDGAGSARVILPEAAPLAAYGFAVFEVALKLDEPGGRLVLRRPDGSIADIVTVGPAAADRSWSRYPVHGGIWSSGTPLTRGTFNLPAAEAEEATSEAEAPGDIKPEAQMDAALASPPGQDGEPLLLIPALIAVAAAVRTLLKRRRAG